MSDSPVVSPRSVAQASGLWFATILAIGFVVTQAKGFIIDTTILVSLAFWVPVGVIVDLWSRRQRPIDTFEVVERYTKRTMNYMAGAMVVLIIIWSALRPNAGMISIGPWIAPTNALLDYVQIVLPGLKHSRSALQAAGRPDIAAYFGAYLICFTLAWVVAIAFTGKFVGILRADQLERGQMVGIVANAFPATPRIRTYVWRLVYAIHYWVLLGFATLGPWAIWHQSVAGTRSGMTRFWENTIAGFGAFAPGMAIALALVPIGTYSALWMRTGLRARRRANRV